MAEVELIHRHGAGAAEMRLVRTERIDHLAIRHYRCACGLARAVLERARDGDAAITGWPFSRADGEPAVGDPPSSNRPS